MCLQKYRIGKSKKKNSQENIDYPIRWLRKKLKLRLKGIYLEEKQIFINKKHNKKLRKINFNICEKTSLIYKKIAF